jgi:hypothetical protein
MLKNLLNKITGRDLLQGLEHNLQAIDIQSRLTFAMARAAATAPARRLDPRRPETWEFSGFSQHGEDGVIDHLVGCLAQSNRSFVEIGAADGIENCTSWLAVTKQFSGLMVEGNAALARSCERALRHLNWSVQFCNRFVDADNIADVMRLSAYRDPDVLVLDIDSIDYYITKAILGLDYRPKIVVVEYNSAFGPELAVTVPYKPQFNRWAEHESGLYYGVSIAGWRRLLGANGYLFVTTELTGANAFFIDPAAFPPAFGDNLIGVPYRNNSGDLNGATRPQIDAQGKLFTPVRDWRDQFERIKHLPLNTIE